MARFIHLFVVVSGFALLAVVPLSFFNLRGFSNRIQSHSQVLRVPLRWDS